MTTYLPTDANNNPIPALRLKASAGAHSIAAGATTARNSTAFDGTTQIVSVFATIPVYLRFGGASVEAANTDHYFPANTYYDFAIGGEETKQFTHLAVLRVGSEDGTVYISEKE